MATTQLTTGLIKDSSVTLSKLTSIAASSFLGNSTGSPATPAVMTVSTAKTLLAISSSDVSGLTAWATKAYPTNAAGLLRNNGTGTLTWDTTAYLTANQSISLTGDISGSGSTSIAATISSGAVTLAKMANLAALSIMGNNTGSARAPLALSTSQVSTLLGLTAWATKAYPTNAAGVLTNDGSGNLTWVAGGGGSVSGGGVATELAYWNDSSTVTSTANLLWDTFTNTLTVGSFSSSSIQVLNAGYLGLYVYGTDGYSTTGARVKYGASSGYAEVVVENDNDCYVLIRAIGSAGNTLGETPTQAGFGDNSVLLAGGGSNVTAVLYGTQGNSAPTVFMTNGNETGRFTSAGWQFINDIKVTTAGKGLFIKEGSNAKMGTATLSSGSATVSTTAVSSTASRIFLCCQSVGGTAGFLRVGTITDATSFTIVSSSGSDTSTVAWLIVDAS